jgi:hypothetical protein
MFNEKKLNTKKRGYKRTSGNKKEGICEKDWKMIKIKF